MGMDSGEEFWRVVCGFQNVMVLLLSVGTVFFVLSLISLAFVEPGSRSFTILVLDLMFLTVFFALVLGTVRACRRRGH
jgi:high-affinity K+ transport system ATPase subunit B